MNSQPKGQDPMFKKLREIQKNLKRVKEQIEEIIRPTARFTRKLVPNMPTKTWQFTDMSVDPDGSIVGWQWQVFRNGVPYAQSTAQHPQFQLDDAYEYLVRLTVTDNSGLTDDVEQGIPATPPPPPPPPGDTLIYANDFEAGMGELTVYSGWAPDIRLRPDPTESGRGTVLEIDYKRLSVNDPELDKNRAVTYRPEDWTWGMTRYFEYEMYMRAPTTLSGFPLQYDNRKHIYAYFGYEGGPNLFNLIIDSLGRSDGSMMDLRMMSGISEGLGLTPTRDWAYGMSEFAWDTWHKIGVELKINDRDASNGYVRVWHNDVLKRERLNVMLFGGEASHSLYRINVGEQMQGNTSNNASLFNEPRWISYFEFHTERPEG